jgi:hypothetical protein
MKKSELKALIREVIEEINLHEIDPVVKDKESGQWKIDVPGIKVFFDITGAFSYGQGQTGFGTAIQIINKIVHGDLKGANHAGFIMSDGRILDAVVAGVGFRDGSEIKENPQNFIIFNVGGSEDKLIAAYNEMKKVIKSYDKAGIARQIKQKFPKLWGIYNFFKNADDKFKETGQEEYFCSEFVATLLARVGILSVNDLMAYHPPPDTGTVVEELSALDVADEIDPVQLYKLIKSKATMLDIVPSK